MTIKEYERLLNKYKLTHQELDDYWKNSDNSKIQQLIRSGVDWRDMNDIAIDKWLSDILN